jgi:hypothetical protein
MIALLMGAAIPLVLALSSCSSQGVDEVATLGEDVGQPAPSASSGGVHDGGLAFAKCLREQGIDFPDPDPNGGWAAGDLDKNDPKFITAVEACAAYRPAGKNLDQGFDPETQEAMAKLTKCLRENGIRIPDPQFDANGKIIIGDLPKNVNKSDPKYITAIQECRHLKS